MYLVEMIFYRARTDPYRHAMIQPDMITTYHALAGAIDTVADRIDQLGLKRGDTVGVCIASPAFFAVVALALLRDGYTAALVRPALLPLLQSAGIMNVIYDSQGLMLSGGRNIRFDPAWLSKNAEHKEIKRAARKATTGGDVIFFTSGTTGLPKKVVQAAGALDVLLNYPLTCASGVGEKILIMPGLSTTFGFNRLCEVLNVGKTACFAGDSESALSLIDLHGIEIAVTSAAQATALAQLKMSKPGYRAESLKTIFVGGGKIEPEAIGAIRGALCRNVINQYGSTEGGVIALTPFHLLADQAGAIALPWTELEVVNEGGEPLADGGEGLIRYKTPQLVENIKRAGALSVPGVRDGWFYPGDMGSLAPDGRLSFAGRSSDVINRGGVKVSGNRIEEFLRTLPYIKEAAACGIVGASGLEEIWIGVEVREDIDIRHIKELMLAQADIELTPMKFLYWMSSRAENSARSRNLG